MRVVSKGGRSGGIVGGHVNLVVEGGWESGEKGRLNVARVFRRERTILAVWRDEYGLRLLFVKYSQVYG